MKRAIFTISLLVSLLFIIPIFFLSTSQAFSGWLTNPKEQVTHLQAQKQSQAESRSNLAKFSSRLAASGVSVISSNSEDAVDPHRTVMTSQNPKNSQTSQQATSQEMSSHSTSTNRDKSSNQPTSSSANSQHSSSSYSSSSMPSSSTSSNSSSNSSSSSSSSSSSASSS